MSAGSNTPKLIISAAIFILLEFAALVMLNRSSSMQNIWMNRISHRVLAAFWGGGENIRGYFSLDKQNKALAIENAKLSERLRLYEQVAQLDSAALDTKLGRFNRFTMIQAAIVKMSRNTQHNYIILNKGSRDGVCPRSGIISEKGAVGIIEAVDSSYSYGITFMNSSISIGARVLSSGITAPIVWDGKRSDGAFLSDIPVHTTVNPGDTVVTNGFSLLFPADIPLGITGDTFSRDGTSTKIEVKLFQDFNALKYVTIVHCLDIDEIEGLEEGQRK